MALEPMTRPGTPPPQRPEPALTAQELAERETAELYLDLLNLDDDGRRRLKAQIADCYQALDTAR